MTEKLKKVGFKPTILVNFSKVTGHNLEQFSWSVILQKVKEETKVNFSKVTSSEHNEDTILTGVEKKSLEELGFKPAISVNFSKITTAGHNGNTILQFDTPLGTK